VKLTWVGSLLLTVVLSAVTVAQDLGPHNINGQGCLTCHTSTNVDPANVSATYRWGQFTQATYSTYNGGSLTVGPQLTDQDPNFHSAVCLVCHDGSLASNATQLTHDHPVNAPYRLGTDGHWSGTVTSNGVRFTPSSFDSVYGRPIRLYVASGVPYVECGSCHDPHNYSVAVVNINGVTYTKPTRNFVRGWYDYAPGGNSASQFCRSCHFEQSNEAYGIQVATM
jgi:hypothetical protein